MQDTRRSTRGLGEQLAGKIESMIAEESLDPGTPLVERALAERFMVSRSPVREALRLLSERGTVGPRPEGGYVVLKKPKVSPFAGAFESEPLEEKVYLQVGEDR
ncbi:MAG TPA: GntR family transcriptional regulator, partial [Ramlibacter sp.]